jgi:hypothetical protein
LNPAEPVGNWHVMGPTSYQAAPPRKRMIADAPGFVKRGSKSARNRNEEYRRYAELYRGICAPLFTILTMKMPVLPWGEFRDSSLQGYSGGGISMRRVRLLYQLATHPEGR